VQTLLISLVAVAFAEVGDKTQLLALVLAARYRKPWPICAGILVATLINHALAGEAGVLLAQWLSPEVLRWLLGLSFISVAIWALFPDKLGADEAQRASHSSVFVATAIGFFLAEMGDRTQVATRDDCRALSAPVGSRCRNDARHARRECPRRFSRGALRP
jgi:putative Ca2+/H+ antiporter (TMEM165/GDT1 family)